MTKGERTKKKRKKYYLKKGDKMLRLYSHLI